MGVIEIFRYLGFVYMLFISIVIFKNYYYKRGYMSILGFVNILFFNIIFFSINEGYRERLGFMFMLFNVIIFSMNGVIEIFGGMGKNFKVCGYTFYLFESYKQANCP